MADHFNPESAVGIDLCERQITFASDTLKDFVACPLTFVRGDCELLEDALATLARPAADLVLCIEAWQMFPNPAAVLR